MGWFEADFFEVGKFEMKDETINRVIFKKDGLYADIWVAPIYKESYQEEESTLFNEAFLDHLENDIIKEGYKKEEKLSFMDNEFLVISHLRRECFVESDVTIRDIMNFVRDNEFLTAFISNYTHVRSIDKYHALLDLPPKKSKEIDKIILSWGTDDIEEWEDQEKQKKFGLETLSMKLYHSVFGKSVDENGVETSWGISPSSEDILDLPLIVDNKVEYSKYFKPIEGQYKKAEIIKGEAIFTLLEILDAIYWELSFYGPPAEAKEFFEELNRKSEKVKELS